MNKNWYSWVIPIWGRASALFQGVPPNMSTQNTLNFPWTRANVLGPTLHPGTIPQLNSSLISKQTILRGVPYLEAVQNEQERLDPITLS